LGWAAGNITSNLKDMSKLTKCAIGKHVLLDKDSTVRQRKFIKCDLIYYFDLKVSYGLN